MYLQIDSVSISFPIIAKLPAQRNLWRVLALAVAQTIGLEAHHLSDHLDSQRGAKVLLRGIC